MLIFWSLMKFFLLHQVTPLHLAAEGARIKMMQCLVDQGADANIQNHNKVNWHIQNLYVGVPNTGK